MYFCYYSANLDKFKAMETLQSDLQFSRTGPVRLFASLTLEEMAIA